MWTADKLAFRGNENYIKAYKGEELIWEKQQEETYTPLQWVYGGGGMGYLLTDVYMQATYTIKTKLKLETYTSGSIINTNIYFRLIPNTASYVYLDYEYNGATKRLSARNSSTLNTVYTYEFGNGMFKTYNANGTVLQNLTGTKNSTWSLANQDYLKIFPNLQPTDTRGRGYIEYVQIFDNGELIRDYRAYKRDSDGVAGFLETISNTFHESSNDVPFVGVENGISAMSLDYYDEFEYDDTSGLTEN